MVCGDGRLSDCHAPALNSCILLFRGDSFRLSPPFALTEGLVHVLVGTSAGASLIVEDTTA